MTATSVQRLVTMVRHGVDPVPGGEPGWVQAEVEATVLVHRLSAEEGAVYRRRGDAHVLVLAGITTTCTSSRRQLLRNWLGAAERKLAAERAGAA